jgi:hypothetical protein
VVVTQEGIAYVIDTTGNHLFPIPNEADMDAKYSEKILVLGNVCYNLFGQVLFEANADYDFLSGFRDGLLAGVNKISLTVDYFDKLGNLVIETECPYYYDRPVPYSFYNGLVCVPDENNKWGFINTKGELIIPCLYDAPGRFSESLAHVRRNGQEMFIDTVGNMVFTLTFDFPFMVGDFSEDVAPMYRFFSEDRRFTEVRVGFINNAGELIIDCQYAYYHSSILEYIPSYISALRGGETMRNGLISVYYENDEEAWFGYIDEMGKVIYRTE